MLREELANLIEETIRNLQKEKVFPEFKVPEVLVEHPQVKNHGDYSSNIALSIAKDIKENPIKVAQIISQAIKSPSIEKVEVANPGFINFFVSKEYLQEKLKEILKQKSKFGNLKIGKGQKINIEFISANPTGPLTLGNGRGGFSGDVLASVLIKAGYKVTKEYYINDIGVQIKKLGHSVIGDDEAVYKGEYIEGLRKKIKGTNPEKVGEKASAIILKDMIKPSVKKMGIKFDKWFSERSLYKWFILNRKDVDKTLKELTEKGFTQEKEGALWFKSTEFGDDKDRVLVKSDKQKTYLVSDIVYLRNKFNRGFDKLIFIWGADHYGYVKRLKASAEALGYDKDHMNTILMQMVRLFKKGKEVKMSKRAGTYVTLDELIDEVGLDATRFFFLEKGANTQFNFDLDLAKERSQKNPVFYAQYAYARMCSIIKESKKKKLSSGPLSKNLKFLENEKELDLIKELAKFPEIVEDTAEDYQYQRIAQYSLRLADVFHRFYEDCRVITENKELSRARLSLISAAKIVFENVFDLMGISAPEKM